MRDFKGNCTLTGEKFLFRKVTFSAFDELKNFDETHSKIYSAIVLKFSVKQIDSIRKKNVSAICEIMNMNVDFRIFVSASHSVFLKKY